jgi:hypothetical protein
MPLFHCLRQSAPSPWISPTAGAPRAEDLVAIRAEMRQDIIEDDHVPPSIESTWPLIQPAYSDAKNSTP